MIEIAMIDRPRNLPPRATPLALTIATLLVYTSLAVAEPQFMLRYPGGVPQVTISGDYAYSTYTVLRAPAAGGPFEPITDHSVLCLGACFADDRTALAGASYLYRFDLRLADGTFVSYGPYLATISPALGRAVGLHVFPNPGHGATTVQLHVGGAIGTGRVAAEVTVFDLAGRRMRALHHGPMERGLSTIAWDGLDDRGAPLAPGVYLLRFAAEGSSATARIVRR